MSAFTLVLSTCDSLESAKKLSRLVVKQKLVACINMSYHNIQLIFKKILCQKYLRFLSLCFFPLFLFIFLFILPVNSSYSASALSLAQSDPLDPLPIDQAFKLTPKINAQTGDITFSWQIAPKHYLYQEKIYINALNLIQNNKQTLPLVLPKAKILPDKLLGDQFVYEHNLIVTLAAPPQTTDLSIHYQGCSAAGFCYPPQTVRYHLDIKNNLLTLSPEKSIALTKTETDKTPPAQPALFYFYLAGLLLAFTPCVLPMLPILASVIITEAKLSTLTGFILSLSYVLSMAATYALGGILAVKLGQSVQLFFQHTWVITLFSLFFVYLGLVQLEKLPLKFPTKLMNAFHHLHHKQQGGHIVGAILLGLLGTLISSPCVTGPLVATLSYISQTGDMIFGGTSLFIMGLGMGTPMIILGTLGGKFIPKSGKWMQLVNEFFAILLFGLAIWMLRSVLPPVVSTMLWGVLALLAGYFMGFLNKRKYRYLPKLGLVIVIYGVSLMLSALLLGNTHQFNLLRLIPNILSHPVNTTSQASSLNFIKVNTLKSLQIELEKYPKNIAHPKIILIDFYADWCISCQRMDIALFQDPDIISLLKNWVLIKADITENSAEQHALMKAYQVFAPPSIYMVNTNHPNDFLQIHGEIEKKEFISKLTQIRKVTQLY